MGWKIVRDNDPEFCPKIGVSGQWRPSADPVAGLAKKLFEEAAEFTEGRDPAELWDLYDVLTELMTRTGADGENHRLAHLAKLEERGGFTKAIEWCPVGYIWNH